LDPKIRRERNPRLRNLFNGPTPALQCLMRRPWYELAGFRRAQQLAISEPGSALLAFGRAKYFPFEGRAEFRVAFRANL